MICFDEMGAFSQLKGAFRDFLSICKIHSDFKSLTVGDVLLSMVCFEKVVDLNIWFTLYPSLSSKSTALLVSSSLALPLPLKALLQDVSKLTSCVKN